MLPDGVWVRKLARSGLDGFTGPNLNLLAWSGGCLFLWFHSIFTSTKLLLYYRPLRNILNPLFCQVKTAPIAIQHFSN